MSTCLRILSYRDKGRVINSEMQELWKRLEDTRLGIGQPFKSTTGRKNNTGMTVEVGEVGLVE